ncbi:MAG: DHA2 family efflux MFS transporter permease subunit [Sporolactobacillus sp.]|jgi:DHA2 family lincomycin resistance protein-like MFS transporter|nr:DHA2 family efflux MFS transporter permease subunit [Sporolactobacillus sp.]
MQTGVDQDIKRGPITVALVIGAFVAILNETFLNIALPAFMRSFSVSETTVQWLATAYMLVIGILMPVTALLAGWLTTRQIFLGALSLFLAGTLICALAPNFALLLVGRIIQAGGAGLLMPVMMNTILYIYPPEQRGGAMGLIGLVIMFAPALGPTLSGLVLSAFSWRWLFFLVLPLAGFSIVFAACFLKNVSERTRPKADGLSIVLSTAGFGGLVFGMGAGAGGGWYGPLCMIGGTVCLIWFVWRQLTIANPILDLHVFRYPMYTLAMAILVLVMMTMFATMILLPLYLQNVLLLTSLGAGFILLPGGLLNGLLSPVMGRLFDRFGPRLLALPGLALICVVAGLLTQIGASQDHWSIIVLYALLLAGMSMVMMPVSTNGLNQLPKRMYPHGTAVMNTLQQVAGGIGTALFVGIMSVAAKAYLRGSAEADKADAMLKGMHIAFLAALVFAIVSLILAFFLKQVKGPREEVRQHAAGDE